MALLEGDSLRYARQLILREVRLEGQERLMRAKVLVIGAGGLGSAALYYLAAAGIGTLGIADYDNVELHNLQRQILHETKDVGTRKVLSAREKLQKLNPDVRVNVYPEKITADNLEEIISEYDFILDCVDRFETKFLINDACVLNQKPYCHAGVVRFEGQIMTYLPGRGPCLRCLLQTPPRGDTCAQVGVMGAAVGVMGSLQALEAIKYILGEGELLNGKVLTFNGLTMEMKKTNFPIADKNCRVCGAHPTILSLNRAEYERGC